MATDTLSISLTNILPHDAVINILSRLPMKSLLQFRSVQKSWNSFCSDPSFIQMHLDHSIKNYEHIMLDSWYFYAIHDYNEPITNVVEGVKFVQPFQSLWFQVWGSCNGLFLITPEKDMNCLWNPSTGEYKKLPSTPLEYPPKDKNNIDRGFEYSFTVYGFGYDKISGDYKVVRIDLFEDVDDEFGFASVVKVYTLRLDSWRRVENKWPYNHADGKCLKLVNGALHWVADRYTNPNDSNDDDDEEGLNDIDIAEEIPYMIVSFNLEDEKYKEIPQPYYYINDPDDIFDINVEVLDGCLCVLCSLGQIKEEVWVMKDYGVKESWTRRLIINKQDYIQYTNQYVYVKVTPIKSTKNGKVLFEWDQTYITVFDPELGTTKPLKIPGMKGYLTANTYVESLVSLNSGTFVWQQQAALESRKRRAEEAGL